VYNQKRSFYMIKILFVIIVGLAFYVCCSCVSGALLVSDLGGEKFSKENRDAVKERSEVVKAELATLKEHPWAGTYRMGLPLGAIWVLDVAPQSGFAYTCLSSDLIIDGGPALYDQNYGSVTWENGCLKLSLTFENDGTNPLPTKFVTLTWENHLYLVPADGIIDFCNEVNSGYNVQFFLRTDHIRPQPNKGVPNVPDKYKPYLLAKPVEGRIIAVGETTTARVRTWTERTTPVTINKGSQDGILPGMTFWMTNSEKRVLSSPLKLTKVSETESEGMVKQITITTPQVGWPVSTSRMPL
jgi:hypothetical protein